MAGKISLAPVVGPTANGGGGQGRDRKLRIGPGLATPDRLERAALALHERCQPVFGLPQSLPHPAFPSALEVRARGGVAAREACREAAITTSAW